MKMQHQLEASVFLMNLVDISNLHLQLSYSTDTIPRAFPTSCVLLLESSIWYDLEMSNLRPERLHHLLTDIKVNVKKTKTKKQKNPAFVCKQLLKQIIMANIY